MVMLAAALLAVVTAARPTEHPVADPCAMFSTAARDVGFVRRRITARDLVTIGDIGRADPYDSQSPFEISPDGKEIAFVVRRANPDTNSYCQQMIVAPMTGSGEGRIIDSGGEFIRPLFKLRNLSAVRAGYAQIITPHWSPDGTSIAYLKREHGLTQIWTVSTAGGDAEQATHSSIDVNDFRWAPDGQGFIIATRPALARAETAIDAEALTGFHFDARFSPMMSDRPFPIGDFPTEYFHVDLATGAVRRANAAESTLIMPSLGADRPKDAIGFAANMRGDRAWTEKREPKQLLSPLQLRIQWHNGRNVLCNSAPCSRIQHIWSAPSDDAIYFLTREGWRQSETALYRWTPALSAPAQVMSTTDALVGCTFAATEIVCADEGALRPRRLVAIDPHNGHKRLIYDPNPQFQALELGTVRRLKYRNRFGIECYSDLVLPPDHKPGEKHPLVVVQYISEGFLRGGIGDEFPIQLLAAKGFAVLSFERPFDPPGTAGATSELDYRRRMRKGWIDRRSVQSALEAGVRAAIATGTVNPKQIGITGFSEGTAAVQWALINSRLFKVAALGVCCEDKIALPLNGGIGYEKFAKEMGYPLFEKGEDKFWAPYSLAQNAAKIKVPILIQTSDDEYEAGLDVLEEFRKYGNPIDLYVFDHEPHFVWHPAHRLAMYRRAVQWFEFWFMAELDCHPVDPDQYQRWKKMRGAPEKFQTICPAASLAS
jgi:dipeptidyl aminopeptidase/acylaminoacyl peptidase